MSKVNNSLIIRCFIENAKLEGRDLVLVKGNTYERIEDYNLIKNVLIINDNKMPIRNIYENNNGDELRIGDYILQSA